MADDRTATRASNRRKADSERMLKSEKSRVPADWSTADCRILTAAIIAAADMGGALRLGYTRDGGAYAIGVYGDGEPYTEYVRPDTDINDFLGEVVKTWGSDKLIQELIEYRAKSGR